MLGAKKIMEMDYDPVTTYKIIPDYTISNDNNDTITKAMSSLYHTPRERFSINLKEITVSTPNVVYFDILLKKNSVEFFLTTPTEYEELIYGKMKTVWNKSNISEVNTIPLSNFNSSKTEICELVLKDFNFKSLNTNKKDLYPLTNMIGIIKDLKDDEKVRVNIAIEPIKNRNWMQTSQDEYKHYKKGDTVNNEMSMTEKLMLLGFTGVELGINTYIEYKLLLFESIFGILMPDKKEDKNSILELSSDSIEAIKQENEFKGLTPATTYKMTSPAFKTCISVMSESDDCKRSKINMLSVANSYKDLTKDNELVIRTLNKYEQKFRFKQVQELKVPTSKKSIMSDKEVAKLIQLPQRDLQNEYKLESIDTREVDIPPELRNGKVLIGIAEKQGRSIPVHWSTDKNIMALAKLFVGCQNAGKTTAIKRTVKDCYKAGYSNIVIDYIEDCAMAQEIAEVIPSKDKVVIRLGDKDNVPALAFNEVSRSITEDMDTWERVRLANLLAEQVEYILNAITTDDTGELTSPMMRYLHSACMVTFIRPGATILDVFEVLRKWDKRNESIRYAKYSKCFSEDDDIFYDLNELHQRDQKGKITGTKENLIIGITNRITVLKKNPSLKAMLNAPIDTEQDFTKYIEDGKSVFIEIPQNKFPNPSVRDIITTFFICRIWLSVQLRKNNKDARLCNVVLDEVHIVPTTALFLSNHVTEFRRHRLGLMISCHFLKQFKRLLTSLKSSGVSYVLIGGTEKENLEMLKEELLPFTVEDGLKLKPYHSLNIVNYGNQYARFITRLPK